jgi:predicted RNA-binding Zn-ribbon protein involved in translation (DUF1610 family)
MSIQVTCHVCGAKTVAPENASGKMERCPMCRNRIYVPAAHVPVALEEQQWSPHDAGLKPCRSCGHGITYFTRTCPKCGTASPAMPLWVMVVGLVLVLLAIVVIVGGL